ncbi:MAG: hypothetical protein EBR09_08495 [Proteobacteria bacterium]|nr:hypothetical protein [Pseudomonadota bacterium]
MAKKSKAKKTTSKNKTKETSKPKTFDPLEELFISISEKLVAKISQKLSGITKKDFIHKLQIETNNECNLTIETLKKPIRTETSMTLFVSHRGKIICRDALHKIDLCIFESEKYYAAEVKAGNNGTKEIDKILTDRLIAKDFENFNRSNDNKKSTKKISMSQIISASTEIADLNLYAENNKIDRSKFFFILRNKNSITDKLKKICDDENIRDRIRFIFIDELLNIEAEITKAALSELVPKNLINKFEDYIAKNFPPTPQ